jgi:hypothetical protein
LLCRHHGFELEILFYYSHRFLNRDYSLSGYCGMAFSEANLKRFGRVRSSLPVNRTRTQLSGGSGSIAGESSATLIG